MIKFENTEVLGWEHAIRGMRNPMNSWDKSDSNTSFPLELRLYPDIGPNDYDLMKRLRESGTDHRKFMRMLTVYVDITAPLYWWKEFDTYKVGTVANSCSTMHKIHAKEFTLDDFSHEHLFADSAMNGYYDKIAEEFLWSEDILQITINGLNHYRNAYLMALKTEDECGIPAKEIWWQMIQLLPSSYNQKRTVMLNYEVLANIYKSRKNHKQDEWSIGFMDWIKSLPYSELITGEFDRRFIQNDYDKE